MCSIYGYSDLRKMSCSNLADNEFLVSPYRKEYDGEGTTPLGFCGRNPGRATIGKTGLCGLTGPRSQCIAVEKVCWWPLDSLWWQELAEAEGQTGSRDSSITLKVCRYGLMSSS